MRKIIVYISIFLGTVVLGSLTVVALSNHYAYIATSAELADKIAQVKIERRNLFQRSTLWHGTIESVNAAQNTISARFINQFISASDGVTLTLHVTPETLIARQELIRSGDEYIGFEDKIAGNFSDLTPGTRIVTLIENDIPTQKVIANIILFGNPL